MSVCVITADFGGRDRVAPAPPGVDAYRVTDGGDVPGWLSVRANDDAPLGLLGLLDRHRLAARYVKTHVQTFVPADYDFVVWIDGSVQITNPDFPEWATQWLTTPTEVIAAPRHPMRDCVYKEAHEAAKLDRYTGLPTQTAAYRNRNYPEHAGLWATTVLVWRLSPLATTVGRSWYGHIVTMSEADQVSLPVVMSMRHLQVTDLPVDLIDNEHFVWKPHTD